MTEPLRPVNLEKVAESGQHNGKKTDTLKKPETSSDFEKAQKEELTELSTERRTNGTSANPLTPDRAKWHLGTIHYLCWGGGAGKNKGGGGHANFRTVRGGS